MTSSDRPAASPTRARRRLGAVALIALTLMGAAATAASPDPDTNIQKPGHVAYTGQRCSSPAQPGLAR